MNPNRHHVIFTANNALTGEEYTDTLAGLPIVPGVAFGPSGEIVGPLAVAEAVLAAVIARHAAPLRPGWHRPVEMRDFRLHSWHQEPVRFASPPLSGPEWDEAWEQGPGGEPG